MASSDKRIRGKKKKLRLRSLKMQMIGSSTLCGGEILFIIF
ncbi:hypothetical protein Goshw_008688 [Gossypium schwendimanii]|uniref:Uncharacterized protein n=1 Tax=Gossypium schwendimanii TaxID=34291 RepID=A0A7J9MAI8_GOSSC|nr:hypothetical protein [Gossypium schwendimanii]